jgi:predicted alpha/beta-fold hydrolase
MTVFASAARVFPRPRGRRERWELPDGDFLDVDRHEPEPRARAQDPAGTIVVCHGLEGSSRTGYVRGLVALALSRGLAALAMNFRGCSGEPNRLARFYHSGETGDLARVVERLAAERPGRPVLLAGFSLGGNVVVKYLGERGDALPPEVRGGLAISVPFDLAACAAALDGPGFWSAVYRARFMRRLRRKAADKARRFPGAFDGAAAAHARSFAEFDAIVERFNARSTRLNREIDRHRLMMAYPYGIDEDVHGAQPLLPPR